jgi:hypothetical protein
MSKIPDDSGKSKQQPRPRKSDELPAHPRDPVEKNPFSARDPRHKIWADETHTAEEELFAFEAEMFNKPPRRSAWEVADWLLKLWLRSWQIWARRGVAAGVWSFQDARAYEQWLRVYGEKSLQEARERFTRLVPNKPEEVTKQLLGEFQTRLLAVQRHWAAQALKKVRTIEAREAETVAAPSAATAQPPEPDRSHSPANSFPGRAAWLKTEMEKEIRGTKQQNGKIKRLSVHKLADKAGLADKTVQNVLNGVFASEDSLEKLAAGLSWNGWPKVTRKNIPDN